MPRILLRKFPLPYQGWDFKLSSQAACLSGLTKGVASQVKLPADLTPAIDSDPPNEILSYFLVDPSEDFHFLDPIQIPNFIFDLCGIPAKMSHVFFCCDLP